MFEHSQAFSGFAVNDTTTAKQFYANTLGLNVTQLDNGFLQLHIDGSREILVYSKPDHTPATYTILNFPVEDIEGTVDELSGKGVEFERYDGFDQDEKGIDRTGPGGGIAWFKDPAGNILSVHGEN